MRNFFFVLAIILFAVGFFFESSPATFIDVAFYGCIILYWVEASTNEIMDKIKEVK